jgi:hypothetical protein
MGQEPSCGAARLKLLDCKVGTTLRHGGQMAFELICLE